MKDESQASFYHQHMNKEIEITFQRAERVSEYVGILVLEKQK